MTYAEAETILANNKRDKNQKKLENNTVLVRLDLERIAVRLHSTNVVTLHADGSYTLNSGGWRTVTTKARMNEYLKQDKNYGPQWKVSQKKREWFISYYHGNGIHSKDYTFDDGINVGAGNDFAFFSIKDRLANIPIHGTVTA